MAGQEQAVTVYTKPDCPKCDATKRRLDRRGIEYTTVDITEEPAAYAYVRGLGAKSAPVVVLGDDEETWWSEYRPDRIDDLVA